MKKVLAFALLSASMVAAQSPRPIQFGPSGMWPLCEPYGSLSSSTVGCFPIEPGKEPYILLVDATSSATVAFAYSITISDENANKTLTGVFPRNDTNGGMSSFVIECGIIFSRVTITITELTATAVQTSGGMMPSITPNNAPAAPSRNPEIVLRAGSVGDRIIRYKP